MTVAGSDIVATDPAAPGLHWALKQRFLTYIARLPDGRCSVTDGAELDAAGRFHFAPAAADGGTLRFRGDVRLAGHHGMLFLLVADPWLELDGDEGTVTVQTLGEDRSAERIPLATFAAPRTAATAAWEGVDLKLTPQGSQLFNAVYEPGEALDDFTFIPLL